MVASLQRVVAGGICQADGRGDLLLALFHLGALVSDLLLQLVAPLPQPRIQLVDALDLRLHLVRKALEVAAQLRKPTVKLGLQGLHAAHLLVDPREGSVAQPVALLLDPGDLAAQLFLQRLHLPPDGCQDGTLLGRPCHTEVHPRAARRRSRSRGGLQSHALHRTSSSGSRAGQTAMCRGHRGFAQRHCGARGVGASDRQRGHSGNCWRLRFRGRGSLAVLVAVHLKGQGLSSGLALRVALEELADEGVATGLRKAGRAGWARATTGGLLWWNPPKDLEP
mmetsp:Transcript_80504/g.250300  ORF Transcript_80504/g.250300 Transcript_80504/m.250300 type:complete len:280 (-) Transcript_80504:1-840(-)